MAPSAYGLLTGIQGYCLHDGPGIRTTVFFKGCPLSCLWCANPEAISPEPQLGFHKSRCVREYRCCDACPHDAVNAPQGGDGYPDFRTDACAVCKVYLCVEACRHEALEIRGERVDVERVWRRVDQDRLFYLNSGGGVTLSGGEPTFQAEFCLQLLKRCREKGVHTALDTCGFVPWNILEPILEYTDLVLYDLKHMDTCEHQKLTGVPNALILDNARRTAAAASCNMIFRMPLVPGRNDTEHNLRQTAEFINQTGAPRLDLLPYHRLGTGKYGIIGRTCDLPETIPPVADRLREITGFFRSQGILCDVYADG